MQVEVRDGLLGIAPARVQQVESCRPETGPVLKAQLVHDCHELCSDLAVDVLKGFVVSSGHDQGVAVSVERQWQKTDHGVILVDDVGAFVATGDCAEGARCDLSVHAMVTSVA
jgi:hypothetical protein